jgi:AmmeMemoRadiSam system protein B/AmmeMemoRadiSam system protein A
MSEQANTWAVSCEEQRLILKAAARLVAAAARGDQLSAESAGLPQELSQRMTDGVFTTLHRDTALRGCIGSLGTPLPLGQALANSAYRTVGSDPRFPPVRSEELASLHLDVSLLGPRYPIAGSPQHRVQAIEIGRVGLRIRRGSQSGLLLPQVATEQGWNALQFLQGVCRKAGLPTDAWRDPSTELEAFPGFAFGANISELLPETDLLVSSLSLPPAYKTSDLEKLAVWVGENIAALRNGATPQFYAMHLPDRDINGIVLTIAVYDQSATAMNDLATNIVDSDHFFQFEPNGTMPLQATSFQLTKLAAQWIGEVLRGNRHRLGLKIQLTVLDVLQSHSGTENATLLEGISPTNRRVQAVCFAANQSAEDRIAMINQRLKDSCKKSVFWNARAVSTAASLFALKGLEARPEASLGGASRTAMVRPPAVAGRFYSADQQALDQEIDCSLRQAIQLASYRRLSHKASRCLAIMSPHAGIGYSGAVAAAVWSQIEIPKDIIVISPKHTRLGAHWSVSPCSGWQLNTEVTLSSNVDLANKIVQQVSGMEFDSLAHRDEHGIELQLPFVHRFSASACVTGIAMGYTDWATIAAAAKDFASLMKTLIPRPLLVISSDMNHFATDEENRRLDRLALDTFQTGDGEALLNVCTEKKISMCGVVPAAFVLETLKCLSIASEQQELCYSTSADFSGDRQRVVGYASVVIQET